MQTGRLILLLLLVLAVAVVVVLLLRRSTGKKEQQRVEAALLRTEAEQIAAQLAGQASYAEQAAERAEVARVEAEQRAREAARLEEEAAEQRAAAESTRREYEETMRRADEVDPDVTESSFATVDERESADGDADRHVGEGDHDEARTASDEARTASENDDVPVDHAEPPRDRTPAGATTAGAATAGAAAAGATTAGATAAGGTAAGATAAGAAAWAGQDADRHPESERIASAADYRDDVPADRPVPDDDVYGGPDVGRADGMSDDARPDRDDSDTGREGEASATSMDSDVSHDAESPRGEWGGPPSDRSSDRGADEGADLTVIADPEAYAATEPLRAEDQTPPVEREPVPEDQRQWSGTSGVDRDADAGADHGADAGADHSADAGADRDADAGADHGADAGADLGSSAPREGGVAIVADPDQYASREPLQAGEDSAADDDRRLRSDDRDEDRRSERTSTRDQDTLGDPNAHAPAETGAAVAENDDSTWTAADDAERAADPRYDTTPAGDWAADEGELLDRTHDRGARLAEEREDLARDAGAPVQGGTAQRAARRISDSHELRDGGFGEGSAAPLDDGGQPLDHPVQGHRSSMTFDLPGDPGYDTSEPDVWFHDQAAAERSGFRRSGR